MKEKLHSSGHSHCNNKPTPRTMFIHLMRLSLAEICQYQQQMHHQYKGNMPPEIIKEMTANLKSHQEDFGKQGRMRKLILANE